jgi:hypothetical protein
VSYLPSLGHMRTACDTGVGAISAW